LFQVIIRVITARPATSGSHAPLKIFARLAAKNATSTVRNSAPSAINRQRGVFHSAFATARNSTVFSTKVPVTATP
jgi:hypothetical protein